MNYISITRRKKYVGILSEIKSNFNNSCHLLSITTWLGDLSVRVPCFPGGEDASGSAAVATWLLSFLISCREQFLYVEFRDPQITSFSLP